MDIGFIVQICCMLIDINIFNMSPLLEWFLDGSFSKLETESMAVWYKIGSWMFHKAFMLVDGIYPHYSRFMKEIKQPIGEKESDFNKWQVSTQTYIERAFGILKCLLQYIERPISVQKQSILLWQVQKCLIWYNILTADWIIENVNVCFTHFTELKFSTSTWFIIINRWEGFNKNTTIKMKTEKK